jgi:hypothetical protein
MTKPTDEETDALVKKLKTVGEKTGFDVLTGQEAIDFMNKEMNKPEHVKARAENAKHSDNLLKRFFEKEHKYKWEKGMGEISGFGGGYELGCRAMLIAGLEYWDANPDLDPRFRGFKDVYGILSDDNKDAKRLDKAVVDAVDGECTGAMHQAVISSILYIKKNGWDHYVKEMSKPK